MYIFSYSKLPKIAQTPYFHTWIDKIGNKKVYTRSDIEIFATLLSKSIAKRLLGLKPGNSVSVTTVPGNGDLLVTRLCDNEIADLNALLNIKDHIKEVKKEIEALSPTLHETLKTLESKERAAVKATSWRI